MSAHDVRTAVDGAEKVPGEIVPDLKEDLGLGDLDKEPDTPLDQALGEDLRLAEHAADDDPGPNSDGDGAGAPGDSTDPPKAGPAPPKDTSAADNEAPDPDLPEYGEDVLALRFTEKHKSELKYVHAWGKWLLWDDMRWAHETTLKAFNFSRVVCRAASSECENKKDATKIASASTVAAVEKLAKADRAHAATVDQWDVDIWALNTPDGVIDLRTGKMRPHRREDYMTKITAVGPGGDCELWLKFLHRITNGDATLTAFLQRMAGYALTGSIQEHAFFFLYGMGRNGKTVYLETLSGILKDYATTAPMETFLASKTAHHPTDIASLRAARLVTSIETEENRRWAEAKIKNLTGGDKIAARFMRQDFFEFYPQFKLMIASNNKPGLRAVDEAMISRLHLVPFTVTIPPEDRDLALGEKLKYEYSGILRWAIEGCIAWQKDGLAPPQSVRDATDEYFESEDTFALWISECCIIDPNVSERTSELYMSRKVWADRRGEHVGTMKAFSQNLKDRGYEQHRLGSTGHRGFRGIAVLREDMFRDADGGPGPHDPDPKRWDREL